MCIICAEWQKGKLTNDEALRAVGEMIQSPADAIHLNELAQDIKEKIEDEYNMKGTD